MPSSTSATRITKARVFHRTTKKPCGGNADAGKNRDLSARKMTPCQIAEAQRLAREWKPVPWKPVQK
jgi:hypothetical protein